MKAAPWGYDKYVHVEVVPKAAPVKWRWHIGPVLPKQHEFLPAIPGRPPTGKEDITMQLTADQQVELSITGEDAYGNPVTITGNTQWAPRGIHSGNHMMIPVSNRSNPPQNMIQ